RHHHGRSYAQGQGATDRGSPALSRALAPGRPGESPPRTPRPRPATRPIGATRRGRASARLGDPRNGVGGATYAPGAAPGLRGGTGGPLGTSRRMCGGPDLAAQVKSLTLERVSFWYPATEAPALRDVSLDVSQGEIVALVGAVGAGASTVLLAAGDLAPRRSEERRVGKEGGSWWRRDA